MLLAVLPLVVPDSLLPVPTRLRIGLKAFEQDHFFGPAVFVRSKIGNTGTHAMTMPTQISTALHSEALMSAFLQEPVVFARTTSCSETCTDITVLHRGYSHVQSVKFPTFKRYVRESALIAQAL